MRFDKWAVTAQEALQAAIGFFKAAGLNWDEASGKFVA